MTYIVSRYFFGWSDDALVARSKTRTREVPLRRNLFILQYVWSQDTRIHLSSDVVEEIGVTVPRGELKGFFKKRQDIWWGVVGPAEE
jgi:hypothetical protein